MINCGLKFHQAFYEIIIPIYLKNVSLIYAFFFECKYLMKDRIIYHKF